MFIPPQSFLWSFWFISAGCWQRRHINRPITCSSMVASMLLLFLVWTAWRNFNTLAILLRKKIPLAGEQYSPGVYSLIEAVCTTVVWAERAVRSHAVCVTLCYSPTVLAALDLQCLLLSSCSRDQRERQLSAAGFWPKQTKRGYIVTFTSIARKWKRHLFPWDCISPQVRNDKRKCC